MASSSQVRRSRRDQIQAQRLADARKERRNRILFVTAGVVVLAVVVAVAIGGYIRSSTPTGGTIVPPNANSAKNGIYLAPPTNGAQTLDMFVDYNCTACKSANLTLSAVMDQAAQQGKVNIIIHPLSFEGATSRIAAIAASCADTVGDFTAYHNQLFISQSSSGFDTDTLRQTIPNTIGMSPTDTTTFQACFDNQSTGKFVTDTQTYGGKEKVTSTPTFILDGKNITTQLYNNNTKTYDPDLFRSLFNLGS